MTHLGDDALVFYSVGEDEPGATAREHLRICAKCTNDLAALTRVVRVGRSLERDELHEPPASVWENIHSELALAPALSRLPMVDLPVVDTNRVVDGRARHVVPARSLVRRPQGEKGRRAFAAVLTITALIVGVAAGAIGTAFLSQAEDPRLVSQAQLEPFPTWNASGTARVEEDTSGARHIVVDLSASENGLTEVWLIDPETSGLVSLGLLSGKEGRFSLPDGLDLARYSVVDVSLEPDDGDPTHSGDSIVRGELRS